MKIMTFRGKNCIIDDKTVENGSYSINYETVEQVSILFITFANSIEKMDFLICKTYIPYLSLIILSFRIFFNYIILQGTCIFF